jgi:hypothetical protein
MSGAAVQSANNTRKICDRHGVIFEIRANCSLLEIHRKFFHDFMNFEERLMQKTS